jgi:hypothetical protein
MQAAALPLVPPLVIVILLSLPPEGPGEAAAERPSSPARAARLSLGGASMLTPDRAGGGIE